MWQKKNEFSQKEISSPLINGSIPSKPRELEFPWIRPA